VFSAIRIGASADTFVGWIRRIEELKKSEYVRGIQRFSDPPRLDDLASLTLDDEDLESLRRCRPGDCGLKLSAEEIDALRDRSTRAGAEWRSALQSGFREALLDRARRYLQAGLQGGLPYNDQETPVALEPQFAAILSRSPYLTARTPQLAAHLRAFPASGDPAFEQFLYWSMEVLGGRPVASITHVTIARFSTSNLPPVIVAARQVYASHYMTGSLALTVLDGPDERSRYLLYLNRSRLDVLDGFFGGLVRRIVQRRLRGEAAEVIEGLRRRLESPVPPPRAR
jgi:hypothetical protein